MAPQHWNILDLRLAIKFLHVDSIWITELTTKELNDWNDLQDSPAIPTNPTG